MSETTPLTQQLLDSTRISNYHLRKVSLHLLISLYAQLDQCQKTPPTIPELLANKQLSDYFKSSNFAQIKLDHNNNLIPPNTSITFDRIISDVDGVLCGFIRESFARMASTASRISPYKRLFTKESLESMKIASMKRNILRLQCLLNEKGDNMILYTANPNNKYREIFIDLEDLEIQCNPLKLVGSNQNLVDTIVEMIVNGKTVLYIGSADPDLNILVNVIKSLINRSDYRECFGIYLNRFHFWSTGRIIV